MQPVTNVADLHGSHPRLHADVRRYSRSSSISPPMHSKPTPMRKRQLGAVDFADQERLLLEILDSKPWSRH